jgi:hypothetical protein
MEFTAPIFLTKRFQFYLRASLYSYSGAQVSSLTVTLTNFRVEFPVGFPAPFRTNELGLRFVHLTADSREQTTIGIIFVAMSEGKY